MEIAEETAKSSKSKPKLSLLGFPDDYAAFTPDQAREERKVSEIIKGRLIIARKSEECEITNLPITDLPEELWELKEVYLLWVNNNKLQVLNPQVGNLTRLQVVKLNNNLIKRLPDEIGLCTSLLRLWLHNNLLESLPRTIGCLCKLIHMSLEKNNLTELPLEFGRLTSVTALSYDEHKVPGSEPDMVCAIDGLSSTERWKAFQSYLRRIDYAHLNKRLDLPSGVVVLPFTQYPNFMSRLVALRKVVLSGHKLLSLSFTTISCFSTVTHLDLSNNLIETIDVEIGNLTALRILNLSGNPFEILPIEVGYLTNLKTFSVDLETLKLPSPEICLQGPEAILDWAQMIVQMRMSCEGDLSSKDLTCFPLELCFVTSLTNLDLTYNQIDQIHPEVSSLIHLRTVDWSNNCLTHLPDTISFLSNVTQLDLDNNKIEILPDEIGSLFQLKSLRIRNNCLKSLPESVGQFHQLIAFYANQNNIALLPHSFGDMMSLLDLRLQSNCLDSVPSSFSQLQSVTQLLMQDNKLSSIPEPVCLMSGVSYANFARNEISMIPIEISGMASLRVLDLEGNFGVEELPFFLGAITQLKILTVECGALTVPCPEIFSKGVPCVMNYMRLLCRAKIDLTLDLSSYGLHLLPSELKYIPELRELNLDYNYIEEIPSVFFQRCTSLTRLSVRENRLREIPPELCNLSALTALYLDDNRNLKRLPKTLIEIQGFAELTITNCSLASPPQDVALRGFREIKEYFRKIVLAEETHVLDLIKHSLFELPPDVPELTFLRELLLSGNLLRALPPEIRSMTNLTKLDCEENNLQALPSELAECVQLEILVLSNNELKAIPVFIMDLVRLRILLVQNNQINEIPKSISFMTLLEVLNLDSNKIKEVPPELGCLTILNELHLSNNPFRQAFPVEMCRMLGLRKLTMHDSHFEFFPMSFCYLSAITEISFNDDSVLVPPKVILREGLPSIVQYNRLVMEGISNLRLNLDAQNLEEVPPEICTITGLTEIHLNKNMLSVLPPLPYRAGKGVQAKDEEILMYDVCENCSLIAVPDLMALTSLTLISACDNQLEELPDSIGDLSNLTMLLLDNNKILVLPEEIGNCTALTHLSVLKNELTVIPVTIGALPNLKILKAEWDARISTPPREISKYRDKKSLQYILDYLRLYVDAREEEEMDLVALELRNVPQELLDDDVGHILFSTRSLSLANNQISFIPNSISQMSNLVVLDLSRNNLTEVADGLCEIKTLEGLFLDDNKITYLPLNFGSMASLKTLSIVRCKISSFPPSIRRCKSLQVLRADFNQFNQIPSTLALNVSLKEMSFNDNDIADVPQIFRKMQSLRKLSLERNKMTTIPQVFMQWTTLTELHLQGNPLVVLPLNFVGLLKIRIAEYDYEHLLMPPIEIAKRGNKDVVDYLKRIDSALRKQTLDFRNLNISELPEHLTTMEQLSIFTLESNNIRCLGDHIGALTSLTVLNMDRNQMQSLPSSVCNLIHLTELSIVKNRLSVLPSGIGALVMLEVLNVQENFISELPPSFVRLTRLLQLKICENHLKFLPHKIGGTAFTFGPFIETWSGGLEKLTLLDVSFNSLTEIPSSVRGLTALTKLMLHGNKLFSIPDGLKKLKLCTKLTVEVGNLTVLKKLDLGVQKLNLDIKAPKEVVMLGNQTLVMFYKKILNVEETNKLTLDGLGLEYFPDEITVMTGLLHLSLQHNKLREIPPSILKFLDLETLNLSNNVIVKLPRMAKFEGLAELYLNHNSLTYLPPSVGLLTDLEILEFSSNPLEDPPPQVIDQGNACVIEHLAKQESIRYTSKLDMSSIHYHGKYLDKIPEPWCDLPTEYMLVLDVSHNWIVSVPSSISRLTELQHFNVSHNRLVKLPSALGALIKLVEIVANDNRLILIPQELTALQMLELFNIQNTYLGTPPNQGQVRFATGQVIYILALIHGRQSGHVHLAGLQLSEIPSDDILKWPGEAIRSSVKSPVDIGVGLPQEAAEIGNLTRLCLDDNGLIDIPTEIKFLTDLVTLEIRRNLLVTISSALVYLKSLEYLDMRNNQIRTFSPDMRFCDSIRSIKFSNNRLSEFPKSVGFLSKLEILYLDSNFIEAIPMELGNCSLLTELNIGNNLLQKIPEELGGLCNLNYLDFSKNQIVVFPSQFGLITSLVRLYLHENNLIYLPPSVANMTALKVLTMQSNGIHVLPRPVCKLYSIESLNMSYNGMTKLLPYIGSLVALKELFLTKNRLTEFPIQTGRLTNLETMMLDHNELDLLHPTVGRLMQLTALSLSSNRFMEIPSEVFNLTNLTLLALDHNKLAYISGAISSLKQIVELRLHSNFLIELPNSIGTLKNLERLSIGHNVFRVIPDFLTSLKSLKELWISEVLSFCENDKLPSWTSGLTSLTKLHIEEEDCRTIPDVVTGHGVVAIADWVSRINASKKSGSLGLSGLGLRECPHSPYTKVVALDLSRNKIEVLSDRVTNMRYLVEINASNNKISAIPDQIIVLLNLVRLLLSNNRLTTLPDVIGKMEKLVKLACDWNRINQLPESLAISTSLVDMRFNGNQLSVLPFNLYRMTQLRILNLRDNPEFQNSMEEIVDNFGLPDLMNFLKQMSDAIDSHSLILSSRDLHAIPGVVQMLTDVRQLDFSTNLCQDVIPSLGNLEHLTDLNLRGNQITDLPFEIAMCKELKILDLGENKLRIVPSCVEKLESLLYLWVDKNSGLKEFPSGMVNLQQLFFFCADYCRVHGVPAEFQNIKSMRNVSLKGNRLSQFPAPLCEIAGLQELNISESKSIFTLHDEIRLLLNLRSLIANQCSLLRINDHIGFCTALKLLSLSQNTITIVPTTISHLTNLQILNLSENKICFFPAVCNISTLEHLNLSNNEISTLNLEIADMISLVELNLDHNGLSELPYTIAGLQNLRELDLQCNRILSLPETMGDLDGLLELRLHSNKLTSLPVGLKNLTNLQVLTLRDNQIPGAPEFLTNLDNLKTLTLGKNKKKGIPSLEYESMWSSKHQVSDRHLESTIQGEGQLDKKKFADSRVFFEEKSDDQ